MIDIDCTSGPSTVSVEVTFPAGLPGFPHAHRFQLAPWGEGETPFLVLRATDDPNARFVVVSPWAFYPDYEFGLQNDEAERLGVTEPRDALGVLHGHAQRHATPRDRQPARDRSS